MDQQASNNKMPHTLILDNRKILTLNGISNVDSFDENSVVAYTDIGELNVKGNNLHIAKLNLDTGEMVLDGEIISMVYSNNHNVSSKGIFSRLFR